MAVTTQPDGVPALVLALVSTSQALITNVADKPVAWLVEHFLDNKTKEQGEGDEYGLKKFFQEERLAERRLGTVAGLATLVATTTATLSAMLLAILILLALAVVGAAVGGYGELVTALIAAAFLTNIMLTVLLAQAARGKLYAHRPDKVPKYTKKTGGSVLGRSIYNIATSPSRYWTALWSLQTLTPYRTSATVGNLVAVYAAFIYDG